MSGYLRSLGASGARGQHARACVSEVDLILNRAGLFVLSDQEIEQMTICSRHRKLLTVSREMRFAKDSRGMARFKPAEWRTAKQISSLFSRLAAKQRKKPSDQAKESDEEGQTDNDEDAEDWEREEALALGGRHM
ncbi:hypothetical protein ACROYT_G029019 [Oculina patagonica]